MKELTIYLNDHLAGSIGALEMLDDLIGDHRGEALESFLQNLRVEIESDQEELRQLMARLEIGESTVRKAGAWVMEKLSRAKLRVGDAGAASLALLQSLESLSLGITGKRSLWRTMLSLGSNPRLSSFDFARLEKRAADQFELVEAKIVEIAQEIFSAELR